jgi:hypothetical protein
MAVNLSPVGGVAGQFFDNNGNPLTGGKIFTYSSGTTTNQATYISSAGVTAHTNPIILDAAGRVPGGEIWLTDGLQYKFVIKTANDVLIGTYDNIIGINSNFVNFLTETEVQTATAGQTVFTLTTMQYQPGTNNLTVYVDGVNQIDGSTYSYIETSSTVVTFTAGLHVGALVKFTTAQTLSTGVTDAALITYQPAGTGAVATTVQAKLRQYVSVQDFGATGNGTTDDSAAIQTAVDAHAVVYFPSGSYKISTPVTLNAGNYIWTQDAELLGDVGSANLLITADNTVVDGFSVDAAAGGTTLGIRLTGENVVIKNCSFYNISYCIHLYPCKSVLIDSNYFQDIGYGVINASAVGYVFDGIVLSNNRGLDCNNDMFLFNTNSESYAGLTANNVTVVGNVYTKSAPPSVVQTESRFCGFVHGTNITVTGNAIYGTQGDAAMHYEGAAVGDVDDSVTITNNAFRDCISSYARFIWLINGSGYRHVNISGNTFEVTSATSAVGTPSYISWGDTVTDAIHNVVGNIFRYRRDSGDTSTTYGTGIQDQFAQQTLISNNQFLNLSSAVITVASNNVQLLSNKITDCQFGFVSNNATYDLTGIVSDNVFSGTLLYDVYVAKLSSPIITDNIFTSSAKSINNKDLLLLQNCRDNQNAGFGRQQTLPDLNKATAYSLGYVGLGANNLLINGTAFWEPSGANNFNSLVSVVGRGGATASASVSALNTKQNGTEITGITYTMASGILSANVAAAAGVGAAEVQLTVDIA